MRVLLALLGLLSFWSPQFAEAQTPAAMYCYQGPTNPQWAPCSATNQLAVNASVSASITGFPTTQSTGTPISVTTGGVTGTLPAGAVVVASNVGATNGAYCKLGASATTSDQLIPPNSWFAFTVGVATQLTCITSTSTTTVNMVGGSGLPTGSGGGGGGSGGSVTQGTSPWVDNITQWNSVALGSPTAWGVAPSGNVLGFNGNIVVSVLPTGAATSALQTTINTTLGSPFQAGGSISNTTFASTQSGNWTSRVVGNIGGVLDASGQNAAAPANWLQAGCQFQTAPNTITATNGSPCQMDNAGNILVNVKAGSTSGTVAQGSTTSGQSGILTQCAVTTGAPTYTTAQTDPLSCDTAGNIRVNVMTATGLAQGSTTSGQTGSMIMGAVTTAAPTNTTGQTAYASLATTGGLRIAGDGTKLLVTPDSVALPANQSVNTAQVNGITTLTGTGAVGTGAQRVAVGTDTATIAGSAPGTAGTASANVVTIQGIAAMTKLLVTPDSVALPANQSVNVAQFGGTSTTTGQVAVSVAPVTATNTALVTALRPDSPGIIALGPATAANSVPVTIGPTLLGSYCMGANTGTMAAGLAGGAPIYSFRYGGANLAIIRKVSAEADDVTTAFVAGSAKFDLIAARTFSASDTGGTAATLTGNNGKLRTSFATTAISDLRISSTATLTAGTRTLDAQPLATVEFSVSTTIDAQLLPTTDFIRQNVGESPLVLANNEGFVIQATVPGTGTWFTSVRTCWDEVTAF